MSHRLRWFCLFAMLPGEALLLSVCFDSKDVGRLGARWAVLGLAIHPSMRLALAIMTALLSIAALRQCGASGLSSRAPASRPVEGRRRWLVFHLAAFAFLSVTMAWSRRGDLDARPYPEVWLAAWVVAVGATVFSWAGSLSPPRSWLQAGRRHGGALLAGILVGVAAWGAGEQADRLWEPLGWSTMQAVGGLLGLIHGQIVLDPERSVIGLVEFTVCIAPQCSGYEGIGLILVFLLAFLWAFRGDLHYPRAWLLLPIGVGLMWGANVLRITALILIGAWVSPGIALGGFHSQAGWLGFLGVALGLAVATLRIAWFRRSNDADEPTAPEPDPTAAYLVPLLSLLAAMLITAAFTDGFDLLYPIRVLVPAVLLVAFRRQYRELRWTWSWSALGLGVAAFAVWIALEPPAESVLGPESPERGLAGLTRTWAVLWLTFRVVGSVLTVPLVEELAFRGYLTRRLIDVDFLRVPLRRFSWAAFLLTSALFGALHGRWLAGTLAGMLYALAVYHRGEITDAVVAHATTNALIAGCVLFGGAWSLWM